MKPKILSYDSECYRLAQHFLDGVGGAVSHDAERLADLVQHTVEDFINYDEELEKRVKAYEESP